MQSSMKGCALSVLWPLKNSTVSQPESISSFQHSKEQHEHNILETRYACFGSHFAGSYIQQQYQQLAVMRDQRYADHPHCVTRDGMQQQRRGLLCTCMSSVHLCRRGKDESVMSNVAHLVAAGCDLH